MGAFLIKSWLYMERGGENLKDNKRRKMNMVDNIEISNVIGETVILALNKTSSILEAQQAKMEGFIVLNQDLNNCNNGVDYVNDAIILGYAAQDYVNTAIKELDSIIEKLGLNE